jgi:hypothetical protein
VEDCVLPSTSAANPFDCDGAFWDENRGGSDRTGRFGLDSDATLNTGTSVHETGIAPAKNRPNLRNLKIVVYQ